MQGFVRSSADLIAKGHLGWTFTTRTDFLAAAHRFIADGLARGEWVEYVGSGPVDQLRDEVRGSEEGARALSAGRIGVSTVDDFYVWSGGVVDPGASVDARVAAGMEAVGAGFRGFRAVVDATAVVTTAEARDTFARFEYLVDCVVCEHPVSVICAYDAGEIGTSAAAELACLHPLAAEGSTRFRLFKSEEADFAVVGEIDLSSHDQLDLTLNRVLCLAGHDRVTVDAGDLSFVDHNALLILDRHAARVGCTLVLRHARPVVVRLAELLDLASVEVAA